MKTPRIFRNPEKRIIKEQNRIADIQTYISDNLHFSLNAALLAQKFKMSDSGLLLLFRNNGLNFKEYLVKVRMEIGYNLIVHEGKSVKEAAAATGYTRSGFYKAFLKYYNEPPADFLK